MVLEKVIKHINIQREYKTFVKEYTASLLSEFGGKIHSIYMCGSIPKGTAKPFESDADFTILCERPEEIDYDRVSYLKELILHEYPFVTKIDTIICSVDDVRSKPNEWGFWIKIICVCIYGTDIGDEVPPILISPKFILDLNTDTEKEVKRVRGFFVNAGDDTLKARYTKGYSKRLIRALYSLILVDTGIWEDDISNMKNAILEYCDINSDLVDYLYACYLDPTINGTEFLGITEQVYGYIEKALSALAA